MVELHYVLGITGRSGTNFLTNLLCIHRDCTHVDRLFEDFFLAEAHRLTGFVDAVRARWNPRWDPDGCESDRLAGRLLDACVQLLVELAADPEAPCVIAKTPSVENLGLLDLMPIGRTVVIVRDGRAVAESGMRSFGWELDAAARMWARGADTILEAQEEGVEFLLVRYEDLLIHPRQQLTRVLEYLDLDPDGYDFAAADRLPVKGSSVFGTDNGRVHWEPVAKDDTFQPLRRFEHWTRGQHARFEWLASDQLVRLGYEPMRVAGLPSDLVNRLRDAGRWVRALAAGP